MNPLRLVGQFTPFISPSLDRFEKKAPQSTVLGRLPYLSFFENWLKYPILLLGRLILSLLLTVWLASLTMQPPYQNFVQEQIDARFPSIPLQFSQGSNTGNILEDIWNNSASTVENARQVAERELWRATVRTVAAGESFVIFRGIVIYLLYSLLFWLFGNDIGSLEKRALQIQAGLGNLAKAFLYKMRGQADYLSARQLITPQDHQQVRELIVKGLDKHKVLSEQEVEYLSNFALSKFGQLPGVPTQTSTPGPHDFSR